MLGDGGKRLQHLRIPERNNQRGFAKKCHRPRTGPTLTGFGIAKALNDPMLDLRDGAGNQIATNDNWKDSQQQAIADSGFAPANDSEAAIVSTLAPGNYTAIVSGKANTAGVSLVEVIRTRFDRAPAQYQHTGLCGWQR